MPRVKIDTPGVTVELDASEASITELSKQALDLYRQATEVNGKTPPGPAFGFTGDRRWTRDHEHHYRDGSIEPVQAEVRS